MADYAPQSWDAAPYRGEIKPYDPSWAERITNWLKGSEKRPSPERARFAEGVTNLLGMTPAGMALSANDLYRAQAAKDPTGSFFAAAGTIPIPGARAASGAAREALAVARSTPHLPATAAADSAAGQALAREAQKLPSFTAYHGSPTHGIEDIAPSARGPMGPGVYMTPNKDIAQRYAGAEGAVYSRELSGGDLFMGMRAPGSGSDVNPYAVWRGQTDRVAGAAGDKADQVRELMTRMSPDDGYPFYARLRQLMGSDEAAQGLLRSAGYKGIAGHVDGPEVLLFDKVALGRPPALPATAAADSAEAAAMAAQRARFGDVPAAEGWKNFSPLESEKGSGPLWHPISKTKMNQPLDELKFIYGEPRVDVPAPKIITPEEMAKDRGVLVGIGGDRSSTGKTILGIGDNQFENPVHTYGGSYFGLSPENEGLGWASQQGIANTVQGRVHRLGKEYGDAPVTLGYTTMGARSGDYNTMTPETLREMMRSAPVSKKDMKVFDLAFASKFNDPSFPGVGNLTDEWIAGAGKKRTALAEMVAASQWQNKGFPDIAAVRAAQIDPNLMNAPTGVGGYSFVNARPDIARLQRGGTSHPSYDTGIPGSHAGQFEGPVPFEVLYPDWLKTRPEGENISHRLAAFRTQMPAQKMDDAWVESVSRYLEKQRGAR